jgi:transcriptional antiterminator RfaH
MSTQWYALQSKPMKEAFLCEQLRMREIEVFYPCLRVHPVNPRSRKVKAYFPGYVFGRLDLDEMGLSTLQWVPGTVGVVSFDGIPSHVPDNLIHAIRRRVDEINLAGGENLAGLQLGETVLIQGGPFDGYEAILDARLPGSERVRVLLKLLQSRQLSLELPAAQLRKK